MASKYLLQIIHKESGKIAEWEPGLSVEMDFVTSIIEKVLEKGVGLFRTSGHVAADLEAGIEEAIFELKKKVAPRI